MAPAERSRRSLRVAAYLQALPEFQAARRLLAFLSMANEVQTDRIVSLALGLGKQVALPRVVRRERRLALHWWDGDPAALAAGVWGIREPRPDSPAADPAAVDLVLVPGLAFDAAGGRLGQGGGYYDRLLPTLSAAAARIAVAFDFQVVAQVPRGERDMPVDLIVTDCRVLRTGARPL